MGRWEAWGLVPRSILEAGSGGGLELSLLCPVALDLQGAWGPWPSVNFLTSAGLLPFGTRCLPLPGHLAPRPLPR